jgi:hypothetical protein
MRVSSGHPFAAPRKMNSADRAASSANRAPATDPEGVASRISLSVGYFRWVICALLLFGTTKNYMDRQVLGILKTTLQHDLGWNEIDYGNLVFAFQDDLPAPSYIQRCVAALERNPA